MSNITVDIINENPNIDWNWRALSYNLNININFIKENLDKIELVYFIISSKYIMEYDYRKFTSTLGLDGISRNPNTPDIILI